MNESQTEKQITIFGIAGSLRRDSYNRRTRPVKMLVILVKDKGAPILVPVK